jgi:hypothetical protein
MVHLFLGEDEELTVAGSLQVARQPRQSMPQIAELRKTQAFCGGIAWISTRDGAIK